MMRFFAVCAVILLLAGCFNAQPNGDARPPEEIVSDTGTIRYVDLEGGFYGIVADDSTRYLPDSLAAPFREDGVRVRFRAELQEDVVTIQMWGQPVRIIDIARLQVD